MDSSADAPSAEAIIAQLVRRYVLLEAVTEHSYKDWHSLRWVSRYLRMEAKELLNLFFLSIPTDGAASIHRRQQSICLGQKSICLGQSLDKWSRTSD